MNLFSPLVFNFRPPRARRLSGDSDSSASSAQSGTLVRRRNEVSNPTLRKETSRRIFEGTGLQANASPKRQPASRSQSRDRNGLPGTRRAEAEERGRPQLQNGTSKLGAQVARPRARSQGRPVGEPVLLISRAKDGQHSWSRAEEPKESRGGSGRPKSPARGHFALVGSRSPASVNRRGSLPATKMADCSTRTPLPVSGCQKQWQLCSTLPRVASRESGKGLHSQQSSDTLGQELEQLAHTFRSPLRLDPSQEQQLYRRLEEEFLANTQMIGQQQEEDDEREQVEPLGRSCDVPRLLQTTPDQGTADSAYCSSSSSSSSLNFFSKYGFQPELKDEPKRLWATETGGPHADLHNGPTDSTDLWDKARPTRWRKQVLSSSSDESNCYVGLNDLQEVQEGVELPEFSQGDSPWSGVELRASGVDSESLHHEEPVVRALDGAVEASPPAEVILRPKSALKKPDRVPSIYKLKLRPKVKPRTDSQPDKKPSKIPTPLSYKAAGVGKPPAGDPLPKDSPSKRPSEHRAWAAFHNVFSSFVEPASGLAESGVADEGTRVT